MDYQEKLRLAKEALDSGSYDKETIEYIFPELKESDDEKIRKTLKSFFDSEISDYGNVEWRNGIRYGEIVSWLEKQGEIIDEYEDKLDRCACESFDKGYKAATKKIDAIENLDTEFEKQVSHLIASAINKEHEYNEDFVKWTANALLNYAKQELEKQGEHNGLDYPYVAGWRKNYKDNKPKVKHSVLMFTTHGIAEGEWLGGEWCQYRWSCKIKDEDVLYWLHLSDLENLEKENGEQKLVDKCKDCNNVKGCITCIDGDQYAHITEQKTTDNLEPKFKVGDWIVQEGVGTYKVVEVYKWYEVIGIDGNQYSISFLHENDCHFWTIQDAKNGDILTDKQNCTCIFREIITDEGETSVDAYCGITIDNEFVANEKGEIWTVPEDLFPATKEQRDLLFQKMKEAGYEWDAKKKELKKIEQKPTWSEEDEEMTKCVLISLEFFENLGKDVTGHPHPNYFKVKHKIYPNSVRNWLKSLKERMKEG